MKNSSDSGNVLFIILIAVALFAALSYAITSSTRSGGKDSSNENYKLLQSALDNYVGGLKGTIDRMIVGGIDLNHINFNTTNLSSLSNDEKISNPFSPTGGAYPLYNPTPSVFSFDIILSNQIGYNGTSTTNSDGNEVVIFFIVADGLCKYINTQNGNGGIIPDQAGFIDNATYGGAFENMGAIYQGPYYTPSEGCITDSLRGSGSYYYHVLYAR